MRGKKRCFAVNLRMRGLELGLLDKTIGCYTGQLEDDKPNNILHA